MTRGASFRLNSLLLVLTALAALASLGFGTVSIAPHRVIAALLGKGDMIASTIVLELRMPRMLLGLLVGAMLGLAGAALQGFLRNPLAEPSVLGASNAAALGAVIALYFGIAELHPALLPLLAIATAMVALILLCLLYTSPSPRDS